MCKICVLRKVAKQVAQNSRIKRIKIIVREHLGGLGMTENEAGAEKRPISPAGMDVLGP
jgi:hypothetical protein